MFRRLSLIAMLCTLSAGARAEEAKDLADAQEEIRSISREARDSFKEGEEVFMAPIATRLATLRCTDRDGSRIDGMLRVDTMELYDFHGEGLATLLDASKPDMVDERCGELPMKPSESFNFDVTPHGKWGQDILQLPKNAGAQRFKANLHTCAYDGSWSRADDEPLDCTLTLGEMPGK